MDRRPPLAVSPRRLRPRPHRAPRPPLAPASSVQTPPGSMKKAAAAAAAPIRASVCAIPSPTNFQLSPIRASLSALPSPNRAEPSPMRQSPRRVKINMTAPTRGAAAAEKENFLPATSTPPAARAKEGMEKESLLPAGADPHDELVALNLAAIARAGGTPAGGPFARGRNYERYSALREERLKRKQGYYSHEFTPEATVDAEAMAEDPSIAVELSKRRVAKKAYAASGTESSVRRSMPSADFAGGRRGGVGLRSSLRNSKEMKKASAASGALSSAIKERRVNPRSSARRF